MPAIKENLLNLLLSKDEYKAVDAEENTVLNKTKVSNLAKSYDKDLLNLLQSDEKIKNLFFEKLENGITIFKLQNFLTFINNNEFLPNSFTAFTQKIGLGTDEKHFLQESKDVVLNFPFKDCVLVGGQTKDDQKRGEKFYNEILAPDEVTCLKDEKVFTNFKRYTKNTVTTSEAPVIASEAKQSSNGEIATKPTASRNDVIEENVGHLKPDDNIIIKGNNYFALNCLKKRFAGKVKLIYIDPPYNTGSDSFGYNDRFNHSSWLVFMKNRLEIAKELLRNDGSIFIQCDDNEQAYLKVLCDEVFGRENFVANCVWQKKHTRANDAKWFSDNHDFILVFARKKEIWHPNLLQRTSESLNDYSNPDNDPRGVWASGPCHAKTPNEKDIYEITTPSGRKLFPPSGTSWRFSKNKFSELVADNRIWFGENGNNVPRYKRFLTEVQEGFVPTTLWLRDEVGDNQEGRTEVKSFNSKDVFSTPKPEALLKRILEISTNPGDIVLDYHLGSGTTAAVAHKMGRQYIGVEQMDYIESVTVERMKKVIAGEQGGVSKAVGWQGGGDFVYCELAKKSQALVDRVNKADSKAKLRKLFDEIMASPYLNYRVTSKEFLKIKISLSKDEGEKQKLQEMLDTLDDNFMGLSEDLQKELLVSMIDANTLCVNYSEIDDEQFHISPQDKEFNREFYGE